MPNALKYTNFLKVKVQHNVEISDNKKMLFSLIWGADECAQEGYLCINPVNHEWYNCNQENEKHNYICASKVQGISSNFLIFFGLITNNSKFLRIINVLDRFCLNHASLHVLRRIYSSNVRKTKKNSNVHVVLGRLCPEHLQKVISYRKTPITPPSVSKHVFIHLDN